MRFFVVVAVLISSVFGSSFSLPILCALWVLSAFSFLSARPAFPAAVQERKPTIRKWQVSCFVSLVHITVPRRRHRQVLWQAVSSGIPGHSKIIEPKHLSLRLEWLEQEETKIRTAYRSGSASLFFVSFPSSYLSLFTHCVIRDDRPHIPKRAARNSFCVTAHGNWVF